MRLAYFSLLLALGFGLHAQDQASPAPEPQAVTFEDVYHKGKFRARGVRGLRSMEDGLRYSRLTSNGIEAFDYSTGESAGVLVPKDQVVDAEGKPVRFFMYHWAKGEKQVILESDVESIYRHSYRAKVWVYDMESGSTTLINPNKVQNPVLSPDGQRIAYVMDNNVYITELADQRTYAISHDGKRNEIINGAPDWVYEEEFSFHVGLEWSPDSEHLAYYRFDETEVPTFSMDVYGQGLYPEPYVFKYPKAGEVNSKVSIKVFSRSSGTITSVTDGMVYEYLPRMTWSPKNKLILSLMNRHQDSLWLYAVNMEDLSRDLLFIEHDKAFTGADHNLTFLKDGRFIWTSDRSGYRHIYLYSANGRRAKALTKGDYEVTNIYGVDEKRGHVYFQAAAKSPSQREIYRVGLRGGRKTELSLNKGWNTASFSSTFDRMVLTWSDANTPNRTALYDHGGKEIRVLEDNAKLRETMADFRISPKTFFTMEASNGQQLPAWEIKPLDFDESKQYPVLMFVYGGPGSQQVTDNYGHTNYFWYQSLAAQGFWIVCVDNRGTGAKGREFEKCTYLNLGKLEVEDQIASAQALALHPNVDASRIGIWGWSYGGFMSSNCLFQGADVFSMAIAVAPVSNWRFYDNIYTERYMRTPEENGENYDAWSPLTHVSGLEGNFLLVHGTGDDNVHVQNAMRLAEGLIQENKDFDYMVYPDKNHGIYGGMTRVHLFTKLNKFILENL